MKKDNGKRKMIKDRNLPSSNQINTHQNFDRVHSDYSVVQKLLLKKSAIWTGAVICVAGVASIVYLNSGNDTPKKTMALVNNDTLKKIEVCVQPPIPGKETPYTIYRISSKKGGVIQYETGSSITIPANAFLHSNGEQVSDSVDIKYREFHTPLDIFLSGIPMEYDSAGIERTLESAGMLDIRAVDNGKELVLNTQTPIDIKMATSSNDSRFNLYELDTVSKNWIYKGKDKIEEPKQHKTISPKSERPQVGITFDNSIRPVMADSKKFSFKIKCDKNEFPELAAYDNVMFEVHDQTFKPEYYKINWKKITLHNNDTPGDYIVKLQKADTTISFNVKPVFASSDYQRALQKFQEQHNAVSKVQEAKDMETQNAVNKVNKELATYNKRDIISAAFGMAGISVGFRGFSVRSLGYHNIDFPLPPILAYAYKMVGNSAQQSPSQKTESLSYSNIFLAQKGKNTVFRFSKGEPVRCDPDRKNLMWTVTSNNRVAFFRIEDYRKLKNGGENNIQPVVATNQDKAFLEIRKFSL